MSTYEETILMAKIAMEADKVDDMIKYYTASMHIKSGDMTRAERTMITMTIDNVIGSKRAAIKTIT